MGVDTGPGVRRGFAFVVEPRPHESTSHKRMGGYAFPGALDVVIGAHVTLFGIVCVDASIAYIAADLAADDGEIGMRLVKRVVHPIRVVDALHIQHMREAISPSSVHRCSDGAGGIKRFNNLLHRRAHALSRRRALNSLFVAERPENNTGMVAIATHH